MPSVARQQKLCLAKFRDMHFILICFLVLCHNIQAEKAKSDFSWDDFNEHGSVESL